MPEHYRKPAEKINPELLKPGNRQYRFYDENDKVHWVKEEDLSIDDMRQIATEYWHYFMYIPADAQEIVIAAIDGMINQGKARVEEGKIIHDMQKASGLHEGPQVSTGGIVMPGTENPQSGKIITFDKKDEIKGDQANFDRDPLDFSI